MAINYHGEITFICPRITSNDFKERVTVYWKMSTRCPNQMKLLINIQMNLLSGFRTLLDKAVYINVCRKYDSIVYILYYLISSRYILNQITNAILGQSNKKEYVVCVT